MTKAWRLTRATYVESAMTGEGARLYGGRWNSKGAAVVYLAENLPLAALEILVHTRSIEDLADYVKLPVSFPENFVETLPTNLLPQDWRSSPAPVALKAIGDKWVKERRSVLLQVPSVIIPEASNLLFNPLHPDVAQVVVGDPEPFTFDGRLLR